MRRHSASAPRTPRRRFVTPEGVDLRLELASGGARAGAFLLDIVAMLAILIALTLGFFFLLKDRVSTATGNDAMTILWLLGAFALRNGWWTLFEMGGRGATPGKRLMGLRVVARDGARLTGGAVVARNAMREIEVFLPLSFLGYQAKHDAADTFLVVFALAWTGIFLFLPLFNRDRLRVGDVVAGTWVVRRAAAKLGADLAARGDGPARSFPAAALDLYGVFELQTLEDVLRAGDPRAIATVARTIRGKAGIADDGDDRGFLQDYYAALCVRLERGLMVGRRRADKHAAG